MLTLESWHNKKVTVLRLAILSAAVVLLFALSATAAGASVGEAELRRVDTANVNEPTDIKAVSDRGDEDDAHKDDEGDAGIGADEHGEDDGAKDEADDHADEAAAAPDEHDSGTEEPESEAAAGEHGEEAASGEEKEVHHPAWMIPGWQSIFTVLAVVYFALGVTLLPHVMAKEEH